MKEIRGVYISTDKAEIRTIEDELQAYYDLLGCDIVEAPWISIGGNDDLCVVCDEEALCRSPVPACSVCVRESDGTLRTAIMGPCFVVGLDEDGEWCSLTSEEANAVLGAVTTDSSGNHILVAEGWA